MRLNSSLTPGTPDKTSRARVQAGSIASYSGCVVLTGTAPRYSIGHAMSNAITSSQLSAAGTPVPTSRRKFRAGVLSDHTYVRAAARRTTHAYATPTDCASFCRDDFTSSSVGGLRCGGKKLILIDLLFAPPPVLDAARVSSSRPILDGRRATGERSSKPLWLVRPICKSRAQSYGSRWRRKAHRTRAIATLCEELNRTGICFPGSALRLCYAIQEPSWAENRTFSMGLCQEFWVH